MPVLYTGSAMPKG